MRRPSARLLVAGVAALLYGMPCAVAQSVPSLGSAASFAVLGASSVTSSGPGPASVTGNAGVSPGRTITGFPPATLALGDFYRDDALARAAQRDAAAAYKALAQQPCAPLPGASPPPGVWCVSTATLSAVMTLDGDANAVWIFRAADSIATPDNSAIVMTGGATPSNVFWQVPGRVTIGAQSVFSGTILATSDITLGRAAALNGRALSLGGAVTLDSNVVTLCCCCNPITIAPATLPDGVVGSDYVGATLSASGGTAPYAFTVIAGALPAGLSPLPRSGVIGGKPSAAGTSTFTVLVTDARGCTGMRTYKISIACAPLPPVTLPPATECAKYEQRIEPGTASSLPPWLPLDSNGLLQGTPPPMPPATIKFDVTRGGCAQHYELPVACGLTAALAPLSGRACEPFRASVTPACALGPVQVTPTVLPSWMHPDLTGTPPAPGPYPIDVVVTDPGTGCTTEIATTIEIAPGTFSLAPAPPDGMVCTPYDATIRPTCGDAPFTFAVSGQPDGVTAVLFPNRVELSGTPTAAKAYTISIQATDAHGSTGSASFPVTIGPASGLQIAPETVPPARCSTPYSQQLTASCGTPPYTFTATGLPAWLTLSPTGELFSPAGVGTGGYYGTPRSNTAPVTFVVTATDANGVAGTRSYALGVQCSCGPVTLTPPPPARLLPNAAVSMAYMVMFTASNGTGPYVFSVPVPPQPPPGLTLLSNGVLSGTPTQAGRFNFAVVATDSNGQFNCEQVYTIVVSP